DAEYAPLKVAALSAGSRSLELLAQQAVDLVQAELAPGDAVLVKASYSDSLWRVAEGLMQLRRSE
ncbi:MAG: UDP-N-acetylmuramoyl-tripeptide--D-alanyl-D-alanine ligase, partial [Corynebacterium durum]